MNAGHPRGIPNPDRKGGGFFGLHLPGIRPPLSRQDCMSWKAVKVPVIL
jgi:hypothetical protein